MCGSRGSTTNTLNQKIKLRLPQALRNFGVTVYAPRFLRDTDDPTESLVPEAGGNLKSATYSPLELAYIQCNGPSQTSTTTEAIRCRHIVRYLSC